MKTTSRRGDPDILLLDTNALLWMSGDSDELGPKARAAIDEAVAQEKAAFSAVSVWEAALLVRRGRYDLGLPVARWRADLIAAGLAEAPLNGIAAALAGEWTDLHDDPADRFIAATAQQMGATLMTSDKRLLAWAGKTATASMDARK